MIQLYYKINIKGGKKMLKELLEKKYQNFYLNTEGVIVGIENPKSRWKISNPAELQAHYQIKIHKIKEQLKTMGNYEPLKKKLSQYERMLKRLTNAINKL